MIKLEWNLEKNEQLKKQRGVCFEDVEQAIIDNKLIDIKLYFKLLESAPGKLKSRALVEGTPYQVLLWWKDGQPYFVILRKQVIQ